MESRDGVEERDTVLMRGFYKAGTKMTPHFRDRIGVSGSRNGTLDPESREQIPVMSPPEEAARE